MNCPNCGALLQNHSSFLECKKCGLLTKPNGTITYNPKDRKPVLGEPQ